MFIEERFKVAGGEMGLATNLGFPYLELSLQSVPAFCPATAKCITLLETLVFKSRISSRSNNNQECHRYS